MFLERVIRVLIGHLEGKDAATTRTELILIERELQGLAVAKKAEEPKVEEPKVAEAPKKLAVPPVTTVKAAPVNKADMIANRKS